MPELALFNAANDAGMGPCVGDKAGRGANLVNYVVLLPGHFVMDDRCGNHGFHGHPLTLVEYGSISLFALAGQSKG